jgi:hypothetical protein
MNELRLLDGGEERELHRHDATTFVCPGIALRAPNAMKL